MEAGKGRTRCNVALLVYGEVGPAGYGALCSNAVRAGNKTQIIVAGGGGGGRYRGKRVWDEKEIVALLNQMYPWLAGVSSIENSGIYIGVSLYRHPHLGVVL